MDQGSPFAPDISNTNIPVIDFSTWTSSDISASQRLATARDLVAMCHRTGFVYITNHGISSEMLDEAFNLTMKFFDLPSEKKMEAGNFEPTAALRGWSWPGLERVPPVFDDNQTPATSVPDVINYTESFGLGSDENPDYANIWLPDPTLPGLRAFTTKFYWECWKTSQNILRALALGLGLDDDNLLLKFHSGHDNELNLRHYPPIPAAALENQEVSRLNAHTDFDSLTLLFQDDCGGLEIQKPGHPGEFIHVEPIPNALVMNIGDVLMRWSNGYLKSTIHRVHMPPLQDRYTADQRMTRKRFSIPYFVMPEQDSIIECLPLCQSETNPPKYEPIVFREFCRQRTSEILKYKAT